MDVVLARTQFEVLHHTVDEIAEAHGCAVSLIEYAIKKHGWKRSPIVQTSDQTKLEEEVTALEARNNALHALKQGVLDPTYIRIEAAITTKTLEIIKSINGEEPSAAARLKQIVEVLSTLRPTKLMAGKGRNDSTDKEGIKIMVVTQVGDGQRNSTGEPVEVVVNHTPASEGGASHQESGRAVTAQGVQRSTP